MNAVNTTGAASDDATVLRIFLQEDELDQAIAEVGCGPTDRLPLADMRAIVADVSMSVAVAVSMLDEVEFAKAIGCLAPRCGQPGANFAARYLRHVIAEMSQQEYSAGLDLLEVSHRFEQINERLSGRQFSVAH